MKRIALATALSCVLYISAVAGEVPSGGYAPPTPEETTLGPDLATPGDIPSGGYTEGSTDVTLTMVQTLLSLLSV